MPRRVRELVEGERDAQVRSERGRPGVRQHRASYVLWAGSRLELGVQEEIVVRDCDGGSGSTGAGLRESSHQVEEVHDDVRRGGPSVDRLHRTDERAGP